jgi:hypothetical protein
MRRLHGRGQRPARRSARRAFASAVVGLALAAGILVVIVLLV